MKKWFVALVNETKKEVVAFPTVAKVEDGCEVYEDENEAQERAGHLGIQAEHNIKGLNPEVPGGDSWYVYFGDTPFKFIPEPTEAERLAEISASVRARRDAPLAQSDWTKNPERPMSEDLAAAWKAYRDALFDLPDQVGFPETVTWPEAPHA